MLTSLKSLSARRAWIEIMVSTTIITICIVALRKESVDRNSIEPANSMVSTVALRKESVDRNLWWGVRKAVGSLSLSARRAWIEIKLLNSSWISSIVALRKESVDRNRQFLQESFLPYCRSPQGERG